MAEGDVLKLPTSVKLQIEVVTGHSSDGSAIYGKRSFAGLKSNVAPADALAVGEAISKVIKSDINGIYINTSELLARKGGGL